MKPYKALLATLILLSLMGITVIHVKAQGPIEAEMLPSQGSANTVIILRFRTVNASVGSVQTADIFWDDSNIALNQLGVLGADGSYNYNLSVPTEPPLSTVGNHTIRVDSKVLIYGPISFNFTFNVTEFVPSSEYLDLNATYNSLLANYTSLLDNYTQLLTNFNETSTAYATILIQANQLNQSYNTLIANYNSLIANYNSLAANYNQQEINYNSLHSLTTNYTSLQNSLTSLTSNYNNLTENYDSLNQTYAGLLSNYAAARNQLTFSTNLNYTLIATTITLAAIIIYLTIVKPKTPTRTR